MSRDPIAERGGLHLYCFVGNEPIGSVDLLGRVKIAHRTVSFVRTDEEAADADMGSGAAMVSRKVVREPQWYEEQSDGFGTFTLLPDAQEFRVTVKIYIRVPPGPDAETGDGTRTALQHEERHERHFIDAYELIEREMARFSGRKMCIDGLETVVIDYLDAVERFALAWMSARDAELEEADYIKPGSGILWRAPVSEARNEMAVARSDAEAALKKAAKACEEPETAFGGVNLPVLKGREYPIPSSPTSPLVFY